MKRSNNFWNSKNMEVGFKALLISLITGLIMIIPFWVVRWLIMAKSMLAFGVLLGVALFFFYYQLWGYFANKFWGWR